MDGSRAPRTAAARGLTEPRGRVLVVACRDEVAAALDLPDGDVATPDQALARVERGAVPDLVVVGPDLDGPVAFAQRLHRVDRTAALVLLSEDGDLPALMQSVLVAPFLGPEVSCRAVSDPLLSAEVAELAEQSAQRRRFRATLASASAQLTAAAAPEHSQAARVAGRLLDDAPLAIVALDEDGVVVGWNGRATDLFGLVEREALGTTFGSLLPPSAQSALDALLRNPLGTDGRAATTILELDAPGGTRYLDATASVLRTGAARESVMLMLRDDTERVVATRELEAARADLAFLVEAGAALAAPTRLGDALEVVAGIAVPTFADATIVDLVDGSTIRRVAVAAHDDAVRASLEEVRRRYPPTAGSPQPAARGLREGRPLLIQLDDESLRDTCTDEEHYALMLQVGPVSAIVVPLVAREQTLGALTFIRTRGSERYDDRSVELARRVGERASIHLDNVRLLKEAQERARASRVLDAIADGVFLLDRDERVLLWNPSAERILGVPSERTIGRRLADVVPGWSAIAPSVPVAAPGRPVRPATLPVDLGTAERWLTVAAIGVEEGTVYAFRDATDDVVLEQMKSDFVATVSHELRTPLASVYGAAVTLDRPQIAADPERRGELIRIIVEEGERLARLVDDILLASTLDAGGVDVAAERVDLRDVAVRAVDAARRGLPDPDRLRLQADDAAHVVGDPDRVRQVLGNLIENALKYSPDDAPVDVEVEVRRASVRVWVRDRGIGLAAAEQARVFEKFYRADPEQRLGVGGTGLGLYISRELVRRMRGHIGVRSEQGAGASFFVDLPRAG